MTDLGLARGSVKGLGAGAYLVNVFPSTVLVLGALGIIASHLYPGVEPLRDIGGQAIRPGAASLAWYLQHLSGGAIAVLSLAVLITSVLLRPFQISAVQVLEGYWTGRSVMAVLEPFAVERHRRRRSWHRALLYHDDDETPSGQQQFIDVVARLQRNRHVDKRIEKAYAALSQYPESVHLVMPTLLGNVLRKAERSAGERYGLDTNETQPRLYPYLSPYLRREYETQVNVLDTAATLTVVIGVLGMIACPLLGRVDVYSLLPVGLFAISILSYRGARLAAARHGTHLAAAFDLHRFEMLSAMHRPMPKDAESEYADNMILNEVLAGARPSDLEEPQAWVYLHPSTEGKTDIDRQSISESSDSGTIS